MMHTIISLADVFSEVPQQKRYVEKYGSGCAEYIEYNGRKRLHRLFSTDPNDYLNLI